MRRSPTAGPAASRAPLEKWPAGPRRGSALGARVDLDKVPLKYQGLNYDGSGSLNRRSAWFWPCAAVTGRPLRKSLPENVEATALGEFSGKANAWNYSLGGRQVCDLDMTFLHDGVPKITKEAYWQPPKIRFSH